MRSCRGQSNSFGVPYTGADALEPPDPDELVQYGEDTWEVRVMCDIL